MLMAAAAALGRRRLGQRFGGGRGSAGEAAGAARRGRWGRAAATGLRCWAAAAAARTAAAAAVPATRSTDQRTQEPRISLHVLRRSSPAACATMHVLLPPAPSPPRQARSKQHQPQSNHRRSHHQRFPLLPGAPYPPLPAPPSPRLDRTNRGRSIPPVSFRPASCLGPASISDQKQPESPHRHKSHSLGKRPAFSRHRR